MNGHAASAPAAAPLLEVRGLHGGYRDTPVLFDIGLQVGRGEIVGLLGRNGMGKTTLIRTVMGLVPPARGEIRLDGRPITGWPAHRVARRGIALVPEGRQVFPNLSVEEHLSAFSRRPADGRPAWTPERAWALFPRLAERRRHLGQQLSGGEQQMLAMARALVTHPRLILIDEATEGLAPLVREEIWRVLRELRAAGHAMIVVDKYVQRLIDIADRHVILEKGRVAWQGSSRELDADRGLWRRFLGV